jgi:hypothetical protein
MPAARRHTAGSGLTTSRWALEAPQRGDRGRDGGELLQWVTIDASLHNSGDTLQCIYSTDHGHEGRTPRRGSERQGRLPDRPPAGFVLYH